MARAVSVSGCSAPETRSRTGTSAANWSRAPAASPACPVQEARLPRAVSVSGCSAPRVFLPGAQDLPLHGQRRRVATASAEVPGQLVHAVTGRVQRGLGVRQQRREHRPATRVLRVAGQRGSDYRGGGLPPGLRLLRRELVQGDRLDQPVHRDQSAPRRADQREPPQPRHRLIPRQLIGQQRNQHRRDQAHQSPRRQAGAQQQVQRDVLGRAARRQPQQPRRRARRPAARTPAPRWW